VYFNVNSQLVRKNLLKAPLPEIIYSSPDAESSRRISLMVKDGTLRQLLPKIYTSNLTERDEEIVKRNLWSILGKLFPEAVISHRSAIEFRPSPGKNVYLTYTYRKVLRWPGVNIRLAEGPPPLPDDSPMYGGLYASSLERSCLENLSASRSVEGEKRTIQQEVIEDKLAELLRSKGGESLNEFRDRARELSIGFGWEKPFKKLNAIVGALLSTKPTKGLSSPGAIALAIGEPYDANRVKLFEKLVASLREGILPVREEKTVTPESFRLFAFFESFFSNYIEGTTFPLEEAKEIIESGRPQKNRPRDSHDILGTYAVCSDPVEMSRLPDDGDDFLGILRRRHSILMRGRPEMLPGGFKIRANQAGNSFFVEPKLVPSTLKKGFELFPLLPSPLARALYMMFLISEVHPFEDGNGRVARLMMNAELTAAGQAKIIIPTVYRDDYLLNLRRLTRKHDPGPYIRMMDRAHAFSHWLEPKDYHSLKVQLEESYAFEEEGKALVF
jgi:hypothetical protein